MRVFITIIFALFLIAGCATIGDLLEGDFENPAQCKAAANEEIAELDVSKDQADILRADVHRACDRNADIMKAREDIRDALKVFKVFL